MIHSNAFNGVDAHSVIGMPRTLPVAASAAAHPAYATPAAAAAAARKRRIATATEASVDRGTT
jgi:phosphoribosylcarboxyaminoimidazole (NCAIR) mutase